MPASGSERVHSPPSPPGPKIDLKHSAPGRTSLVKLSWHHDTTRSTGPFGTLASDISRIHKPPLIVIVALSRLYLGVHYPSDVLASLVLAAAVFFLARAIWILIGFTRRNRFHPGV